MWNGTLSPGLRKNSCEHGSLYVEVGEPEEGLIPIYVQFNHYCSGNPAPSNNTVYTFEVDADGYGEEADDNAADIRELLGNMTTSEKLKWLRDQMVKPALPQGNIVSQILNS